MFKLRLIQDDRLVKRIRLLMDSADSEEAEWGEY